MPDVKPIPDGYPRVSPHLSIAGAAKAIHFDVFKRATGAGASTVQAPEDHFYGDRVAMFDDPFGHRWNIATHIEDVPPEEMEQRAAAAMGGG
jgi:hypothetical protein